MATEAQRNFRREVNELIKERKKSEHNDKRRFIIKRSLAIPKQLTTFLGIVIIAFLSIYFISIVMKIVGQATSNNQKPIIVYIEKMLAYDNQLGKINQSVNNFTKGLDMKSINSRKKFVNSMDIDLKAVKTILDNIKASNAPEELMEFKKNSIKRYENFYKGIGFYIAGVSKNNRESLVSAEGAFKLFNIENSSRNADLVEVFKTYKIEFEIQKDGSIRFWYKI